MAEAPLRGKLQMKPGDRVLVLNAPHELREAVGGDDEGGAGASPEGGYDVVHLFVRNKAEVDANAAKAIAAVRPRGMLWVSYPKKSSKVRTDITRDVGWESLTEAGWRPIRQISIDDTWSSLRFRPESEVGT